MIEAELETLNRLNRLGQRIDQSFYKIPYWLYYWILCVYFTGLFLVNFNVSNHIFNPR